MVKVENRRLFTAFWQTGMGTTFWNPSNLAADSGPPQTTAQHDKQNKAL